MTQLIAARRDEASASAMGMGPACNDVLAATNSPFAFQRHAPKHI